MFGGAALGSALPPHRLSAEPVSENRRETNAGARSQKPNILWITTEGVPLKALSCYGSRLIRTPHIDRIANEGLRFENSFATNSLCAPAELLC
jgi:Sulfatase